MLESSICDERNDSHCDLCGKPVFWAYGWGKYRHYDPCWLTKGVKEWVPPCIMLICTRTEHAGVIYMWRTWWFSLRFVWKARVFSIRMREKPPLWSMLADKRCGGACCPLYYVDCNPYRACWSHLYVTNVMILIAICVESSCFEHTDEGKTAIMIHVSWQKVWGRVLTLVLCWLQPVPSMLESSICDKRNDSHCDLFGKPLFWAYGWGKNRHYDPC
jgi:hypothetical protein